MKVFIGAENIISPLGNSAEENFASICEGNSGITGKDNLFLARFNPEFDKSELLDLCFNALDIPSDLLFSSKTKIIISSTKGYVDDSLETGLIDVFNRFVANKKLCNSPIIISNACISGVLAIHKAAELIRTSLYENVVVIGIDFLSDFVTTGFKALFALSDEVCKPFDKNRKGINLGEGCAAVVLSKDSTIFKEEPLEYISGSSSNDANHISGPSRTGEGLYRSIKRTLNTGNVEVSEIGYISAHGTGTAFNDNMESIAFSRLGLSDVKLNSLKGYFGHTLGAAGVIEVVISMQQLRNQKLIKSLGFDECGTDIPLNIIMKTEDVSFNTFLKTASGFGGGNASIIIKKP